MIDKTPTADVMRGWVESHRAKHTPVQQFDIKIDANGQWYHEGSAIHREKMVSLFASILTRLEDGAFALVTPGEIGTITVEDAPLIVTQMDISGAGDASDAGDVSDASDAAIPDQIIQLSTSIGDTVVVDAAHPIELRESGGVEKPYIMIRNGLDALINRAVFYDMADHSAVKNGQIGIWSSGVFHPLSSQPVDQDDE